MGSYIFKKHQEHFKVQGQHMHGRDCSHMAYYVLISVVGDVCFSVYRPHALRLDVGMIYHFTLLLTLTNRAKDILLSGACV